MTGSYLHLGEKENVRQGLELGLTHKGEYSETDL